MLPARPPVPDWIPGVTAGGPGRKPALAIRAARVASAEGTTPRKSLEGSLGLLA